MYLHHNERRTMTHPLQDAAPIQTAIISLPFRVFSPDGMLVGQYQSHRAAVANTRHIPGVTVVYQP